MTSTTIQTDAGPISREDYLIRATAQFEERGGLHFKQARECARIQLDQELEDPSGRSPEEAADDEMDCWTDDGE